MRIIFGRVIKNWYISLNINFGVNRTTHVFKSPVLRLDLYGFITFNKADPMDRYSPFSIPTSVWVLEAYVQIFKSVAFCVRTQSDGQTDIAQMP